MSLFVLTMVNGPAYDRSRPRREQRGWDGHAAFMDGLLAEGFVVLGGPIGDGDEVMLVVEADTEREARARMEPDPWAPTGVLEIGSVRPWAIWLDSRPCGGAVASTGAARAAGC
ncbi:MAG: YciI family protein [Streptosporangiaceae bacterium]